MENSVYSATRTAFDREANDPDGMFSKEMNHCDNLSLEYLSTIVKPDDKVLEIGCGYGNVIEKLNCQQYGVDISEGMLGYCQIENKSVGNMDELAFEDETFDVVFMIMTLQHSKDRAKTLSEMKRVTKKGGIMVIIDGNKTSGIGQERERLLKIGAWKTCGEAQWLDGKDFPDWNKEHFNHILILTKTK